MENREKFILTYFAFSPVEYEQSLIRFSKEALINLLPTYTYDPAKHSLARFEEYLSKAEEENLPVLLYDARISYKALEEKGEESFRLDLDESLKVASKHKNVLGYFLGDEPYEKDFPYLIRCNKIIAEKAPNLSNYVNFFPYFNQKSQKDIYSFSMEEYPMVLARLLKESGLKLWGMDHYGILWEYGRERGVEEFFKTIDIMKKVASLSGLSPWLAGCSIGHFQMAHPHYEDFRYVLSLAFLSGFSGVSWYKFADSGFGLSALFSGSDGLFPVTLNGKTSATYDELTLAQLWFKRKFSQYENLTYLRSLQVNFSGHQIEDFSPDEEILDFHSDHSSPFLLSVFVDERGKRYYFAMNLNQEKADAIHFSFSATSNYKKGSCWLRPGEMALISNEK